MHDELKMLPWPGWTVVRRVGRGSFGTVYEIQKDLMGDLEKAALKVVSIPQDDSDLEELYVDGHTKESVTEMFQNHLKDILYEYAMMKKLNECVNIVKCDDVHYVQHGDGIGWDVFIKMELLTPLHKALPDKVTDEMVIHLAKDMCSALEMCKKYDVVHRDIKPQNIFVSPNGNYKLGDFGIAKTVEKTTGGTKIGTYKYMAPEVYAGKPYGSAADIYSLGLVLYWLLNECRMPFMPLPHEPLGSGADEAARRRRLAGEQIPEPAHGSRELKQIVLKACAFDAKDRYGSASEMLKDLNALKTNPAVVGAVPATKTPAGKKKTIVWDEPPTELSAGRTKTVVLDKSPTDKTQGKKSTIIWVDSSADQTEGKTKTILMDKTQKKHKEPKKTIALEKQQKESTKKKLLPMIAAGIAILILLLLLIRGCDSKSGKPAVPDEVETVALSELVTTTEPVALFVGDTFDLGIDTSDGKCEFATSSEEIVEVSKKGELTAVGAGTATITITRGDESATITVNVQDYEMTLSPDSMTLFIDATAPLEVLGLPEGAEVKWSAEEKKVADVDNGIVTAKGEGTTKITATWKNGKQEYTASIDVKVEPDGVVLTAYEFPNLFIGDTKTIEATASRPELTVTWDSSNKEVATVANGKITAVGAGTATIYATAGTKTAECVVKVQKPSVTLKGDSGATIFLGDSITIGATANPGTAEVKWSSSEEGVAKVSNGKITTVSTGSADIVAKIQYAGQTYTSKKFTVQVSKPSVKLDKESLPLMPGDSGKISATTNPSKLKVTWESSAPSIVSVSTDGTVKALAEGSATITAKITYNNKTYTSSGCKVTVTKPSITITASSSKIEISERDKGSVTLTAKLNPGKGEVKWSISDPNIATISGNGTTATVTGTGKAMGDVRVTATYTVNGTTVKATYDLQAVKAKSTLKIYDVSWPSKSSLNAFYFDAKVKSNYQLTRLEMSGKAVSVATGLSVTDSGTYYFTSNVYETNSTDAANMTNFLKEYYRGLYDLYGYVAGVFGADDSLAITATATFYDSSGNTASVTIAYTLTEK